MKKKRIFAILGLVIIGLLYIAAIVCALIGTDFSRQLLMAALFSTMVIPAVLYSYQLLLRAIDKRNKENQDESKSEK